MQSATGGTISSARGFVRSDTPGRQVCLELKESPPRTSNFSDSVRCVTTTTGWKTFRVVSRTPVAGNTLTVNVVATNPLAANSFEVDGLTLTK